MHLFVGVAMVRAPSRDRGRHGLRQLYRRCAVAAGVSLRWRLGAGATPISALGCSAYWRRCHSSLRCGDAH
jgi:hypothetical protein